MSRCTADESAAAVSPLHSVYVVCQVELRQNDCSISLTAGTKESGLRPSALLRNVLDLVPELSAFANLDLKVVYNKDSSNCGPREWQKLATMLHEARDYYDAFLVIHGTDTMVRFDKHSTKLTSRAPLRAFSAADNPTIVVSWCINYSGRDLLAVCRPTLRRRSASCWCVPTPVDPLQGAAQHVCLCGELLRFRAPQHMTYIHAPPATLWRASSFDVKEALSATPHSTSLLCAHTLTHVQTGFKKPIVVTGSQLPLAMPRSDARQNLIDSVTCLTAYFNPPHVQLQEVAVCFGGRLMRGNRCQKTHSSFYQAFDSLTFPYLANLGVDIDWNLDALLHVSGVYRPRLEVCALAACSLQLLCMCASALIVAERHLFAEGLTPTSDCPGALHDMHPFMPCGAN